jgi:hypothetical protein
MVATTSRMVPAARRAPLCTHGASNAPACRRPQASVRRAALTVSACEPPALTAALGRLKLTAVAALAVVAAGGLPAS